MHAIVQILIAWGIPGLFLLAVADSAGAPLPAGVDALLVTLAVMRPGMAYLAATLAVLGSALGCMILFYIARKGGQRYLDARTQAGRAHRFRAWFQRYGLATVFVPALLPVPPLPTKVFVLSAGAMGARPGDFLLVVLAARFLRYFGLAYLGVRMGEESRAWLRGHAWHLAVAGIGVAASLLLILRFLARPEDQAVSR
jgi:membrane protein DedA with SNARE-associated domain